MIPTPTQEYKSQPPQTKGLATELNEHDRRAAAEEGVARSNHLHSSLANRLRKQANERLSQVAEEQ